jgi:hypothetical protein
METSIIVAIVGILGIIIGSSLQSFLGKHIEASKQFKLLQTQTYVDFLRGWAGTGRARFFGDKEKEIEFTILLSEARAKISVYGSKRVVKALAEFINKYNENHSQEGKKAFARLIQIMREESLSRADFVEIEEIQQIISGGKSEREIK